MRISDWSSDVCSSDLRDLKFADLGEGIVGPRIVIERLRAGGTREIIGTEPVGAEHDRIGGDRAEMLDEAREAERDLRPGRPRIPVGGRVGTRGDERAANRRARDEVCMSEWRVWVVLNTKK